MAKATTVSNSQTEQAKTKDQATGSKLVRLAVSLQNGIKFLDIHSAPDGCVILPGVNDHIKTDPTSTGILLDRGASVCVALPPEQWEEVKAKYGAAHVFTAVPPFIREIKDEKEYNAIQDELKEIKTGAEPSTTEELQKAEREK